MSFSHESHPIDLGPAAPAREASLFRFRILLVDDNETAAQGLRKLLEYKRHEVCVRYTGESALAAVAEFRPDVVLLDIGLPDISGYDVARRILQERSPKPHPVLIALTGYGQADDKRQAAQAGIAYHLTKPAGIADIEAILARIAADRNDYTNS